MLLDEDEPERGTFVPSTQAAVEGELEEALATRRRYVFRCIVAAGGDAARLIRCWRSGRFGRCAGRWEGAELRRFRRRAFSSSHDNIAEALSRRPPWPRQPGVYNLIGPGELTISDLARARLALVPPHLAVGVAPRPSRWYPADEAAGSRQSTPSSWTPPAPPQAALDAPPRRARDAAETIATS